MDDGSEAINKQGTPAQVWHALYHNMYMKSLRFQTITSLPDGCGNIKIEWKVGIYSDPWMVCKQREGRNYVTQKENITC